MDVVLIWLKRHKIEFIIFAMLFFAGSAFYHPIEYDNTTSRYLLLSAIVDHGTLSIDDYKTMTIDKSEWDGHYYSNKAPGASFLGAPVYWMIRNLTSLKKSTAMTGLEKYIIRVITTTLLFALLGVVMYRLAQFCGVASRPAVLMVIAYGFGTIALLHATMFSGHQIAASLSFFSFALLVRASSDERTSVTKNWSYGVLASLFAGFAVITDYTAVVISICLASYVMASRSNRRLKAGFIFGACICAFILSAYNMACFGTPFSFSYEHQVFEVFRKGAAQGFCGISVPKIEAIVNLLFFPARGVFFIMPVLLLSFWGIADMFRRVQYRREAIFIIATAAGSLLFVAGYYFWHGSTTFGPRFLVPMLPFFAFPLAFLNWRPYIFWVLFILSGVQVGLSVWGMPHVPHLIKNPIVELILPGISSGYTALNAGMLLGLEWPWSVIIIIALVGLLGSWALHCIDAREPSKGYDNISVLSKTILLVWIVAIIVMLAVIRSDSPDTVHFFKSKVFEDASDYFNNRGMTYGEQGQYLRAIDDFNRAIRLTPDDAAAYNNRGATYLFQGYNELGCKDAQKACDEGICTALTTAKGNGLCR